jgi:general secretion pathway protein K
VIASGSRRKQRGIAMMVAILLVAFGTILAAGIAFKSAMAARRSTATLSMDQSLLVAQAAEALAAYALRESKKSAGQNAQTHGAEAWAQPLGPVEVIPGIVLEAYVSDESSRFNLNSLVDDNGQVDPIAVEKLEDLMEQAGIERKWASVFADWIDTDTQPLPNGAEDSAYAAQDPPYRAPNIVVTSASELLAMPEFGRERYVKIAPFVTALPRDATVNVCTASGLLLDALVDASYKQYSQDPELLPKERENGCFPTAQAYQQNFSNQQDWTQKVQPRVKETSDYFRLTSIVTIGSAEFTLYSLLWREPGGQVRVMMRSFSPD